MRSGAESCRNDADESQSVSNQAGHTRLGVMAVLAALAAIGAYGAVKGFNTEPRAEGGITLSDKTLNTELQCVRDAFFDAGGGTQLTRNRWMAENCSPKIRGQIDQALDQKHPLDALKQLRDEIFRKSQECEPGAETWVSGYQGQSDGFAPRIDKIDTTKCKAAKSKFFGGDHRPYGPDQRLQ